MFDFPIHTNEAISRASSRGSTYSDSSRKSMHQVKSTRSQIGNSPLTSKEYGIAKNNLSEHKEYSHTVADVYKQGPAPSERMKKFNSSQPPVTHHNGSHSSMIDEYKNLNSFNQAQSSQNDQHPKNVTHNLRLLKTKMRLNSATSNESVEPYVNVTAMNGSERAKRNPDAAFRNSSGNVVNSSYDDPSSALVSCNSNFSQNIL